jgi:hypothetical protein
MVTYTYEAYGFEVPSFSMSFGHVSGGEFLRPSPYQSFTSPSILNYLFGTARWDDGNTAPATATLQTDGAMRLSQTGSAYGSGQGIISEFRTRFDVPQLGSESAKRLIFRARPYSGNTDNKMVLGVTLGAQKATSSSTAKRIGLYTGIFFDFYNSKFVHFKKSSDYEYSINPWFETSGWESYYDRLSSSTIANISYTTPHIWEIDIIMSKSLEGTYGMRIAAKVDSHLVWVPWDTNMDKDSDYHPEYGINVYWSGGSATSGTRALDLYNLIRDIWNKSAVQQATTLNEDKTIKDKMVCSCGNDSFNEDSLGVGLVRCAKCLKVGLKPKV